MKESLFERRVKYFLLKYHDRDIKTKPIKRAVKVIDSHDINIHTIYVPLPKNILKDFSIPEDCAEIVLVHMLYTLHSFSREKNINSDQLDNLAKIIILYINELDNLNLTLDSLNKNDLITDLHQLMEKYKKNNPMKNNLRRVFLLISLLQKSYLDTL